MGKLDAAGLDRRQIISACYLLSLQIVFFLILFNIRGVMRPPKCEAKSPSMAAPANFAKSVWYYEHIYQHEPAQLRVLTNKDGAAPLLSKISPREREITIVTETTRERLPAVESTAMTWSGALSLAVHVLNESDIAPVYEQLKQIHTRVETHGRCRLDIQLVKEDSRDDDFNVMYPTNGMRNIAWRMARTKLILLLDAEFTPSPGMHESLTGDEDHFQSLLKATTEERQLLVVSAFEFTLSARENSNGSWSDIPRTKEELKKGWETGAVDCFQCAFSPAGHEPTNFRKFFDPANTTPYSIRYREGYQPYLIVAKDSTPMYDERFRGYGKNKISHMYSCVRGHGMSLRVLPNAFVFELPHLPSDSRKAYWGAHSEVAARNLLRIRGLYRRFKSELNLPTPRKEISLGIGRRENVLKAKIQD